MHIDGYIDEDEIGYFKTRERQDLSIVSSS